MFCRMVGGSDSLRLPQLNNDSYLMDYVPNVNQMLQEKAGFSPAFTIFVLAQ